MKKQKMNKVLDEQILTYKFLLTCLNAYLSDIRSKSDKDPLISPILADDELLKNFPICHIIVGDIDVFHDDSIR